MPYGLISLGGRGLTSVGVWPQAANLYPVIKIGERDFSFARRRLANTGGRSNYQYILEEPCVTVGAVKSSSLSIHFITCVQGQFSTLAVRKGESSFRVCTLLGDCLPRTSHSALMLST